jgi:hypothetical protein
MGEGRGRFGAIRWEDQASLEDAIRLVKACHDPNDAVRVASSSCRAEERWAVVDLTTMSVLASGPPRSPARLNRTPPVRSARRRMRGPRVDSD